MDVVVKLNPLIVQVAEERDNVPLPGRWSDSEGRQGREAQSGLQGLQTDVPHHLDHFDPLDVTVPDPASPTDLRVGRRWHVERGNRGVCQERGAGPDKLLARCRG